LEEIMLADAAPSPLAPWESFYVITGSSAAALTGLQFVVIVLGAEIGMLRSTTMRAFATPTVVHFSTVLLISATLSAPWHMLANAGFSLAACGIAGFVYAIMVVRHARRQTAYVPVLEDWVWHGAFPVIAYAALAVAAIGLRRDPELSLFVIGATAVFLLFIGIHNAWDAVTYIALDRQEKREGGVDRA
jgi:hypothetical protein